MKIGIVIGSIREGRRGEKVARWVHELAQERTDAEFDVVDLKTFDLPLLTSATVPGTAKRQYDDARVTAWSQAIDSFDGFVFVTPEYNHGVPGAFKNAVDSLGPEWTGKVVAFASYGAERGVRSVEQWRQILANFQIFDVRAIVAFSNFEEFDGEGGFAPHDRRTGEAHTMFDQLIAAVRRSKA